jgi:2-polyprenyl-3-methyl-5-hydroxy-6-metoxy-1,4-benzoquinol methylase
MTASMERSASVPQQQTLADFWQKVVDPQGIGLSQALAAELASFTGEPVNVVLQRMSTGLQEFKQLWDSQNVNVADPSAVQEFYREQFVEAYELANWHSGEATGEVPLNYPHAALFAKKNGLRRALDFGSGIGTGSLCLAEVGCEVDSADVAQAMLKFVRHRMERRGYTPRLIDLAAGETPRRAYYDIVTCFDVLEHIPDQMSKLLELQSYLRVGGYLFVNLMKESSHPDKPMHISSATNRVRMIRRTSMVPCWEAYLDGLQVLQLKRTARLRNLLASWVDRMQGH